MDSQQENMARFLGLYAGWVGLVNTVDGPWRHWTRGTHVDAWTATHVFSGALAQRMGLTFNEFMVLGVLNEVAEAWIRANRPEWVWGESESPQNIVIDIVSNAAGWLLADEVGR